MLAASERFLASLRTEHVVAIRATIEQPDAAPLSVPVIGGDVTLDATAAVRRRGSVTVPWTLDPADEADLGLDVRSLPFGSYLFVERGVRYGDGTREYVPLGRLRIDAVSWRTTEGAASFELSDRMAQLADTLLNPPYSPAGLKPSEAITALAALALPGVAYDVHVRTDVEAEPVLADVTYTADASEAANDLARSIGAVTYFDAVGDLVIEPAPSATGEPVWRIDSGTTGVLIDADESLDRSETFNGVLARGQADAGTPPVEALVTDDDPESPTRWDGPFGRVVLLFESQAVQSIEQAEAAATAMLTARLGLGRSLTIDAVPNPALEPGDVITVAFPDGREETHLIGTLRVPVNAIDRSEIATTSVYAPAVPARRYGYHSGAAAWRALRASEAVG